MKDIRLGISPCPNDTFIFYHLLKRQRLHFDIEPIIKDVEVLNRMVLAGHLDVSKVSFALAGRVLDRYIILESGAALGRGCGPLILSKRPIPYHELSDSVIAIPGKNTTATLLLQLYAPEAVHLVEMPFDKIVQAICRGDVDAGCVIHETRFTYKDFGLVKVQDLGKWWEETTGMPIPLGGIIAKRKLMSKQLKLMQEAIKKSITFAKENFHEVSLFVKDHAQEISSEVQKKHIDLYVNEYSYQMGTEGRGAVRMLFQRAMAAGLMETKVEGPIFLEEFLSETEERT